MPHRVGLTKSSASLLDLTEKPRDYLMTDITSDKNWMPQPAGSHSAYYTVVKAILSEESLVREERLELSRSCDRRILNPLRLPFHHSRKKLGVTDWNRTRYI